MRRVGVLQTILLIPLSDPTYLYEIVDGEGRHYSAVDAQLSTIPAMIVEGATREQAMAMRTVANIDRGPNIVAEARAIKQVIDTGQYPNLKTAAADLEVPLATLRKRLKLTELPADMLDGVHAGQISAGVLESAAGLAPEYRVRAVAEFRRMRDEGKVFTAADLKGVQVKRSEDLGGMMADILSDIPAALPLLHLTPTQLLAQDVKRRCEELGIEVADLLTELARSSGLATPVLPQDAARPAVQPGDDSARQREADRQGERPSGDLTTLDLPFPADPPARAPAPAPTAPEGRRRVNIGVDR